MKEIYKEVSLNGSEKRTRTAHLNLLRLSFDRDFYVLRFVVNRLNVLCFFFNLSFNRR